MHHVYRVSHENHSYRFFDASFSISKTSFGFRYNFLHRLRRTLYRKIFGFRCPDVDMDMDWDWDWDWDWETYRCQNDFLNYDNK